MAAAAAAAESSNPKISEMILAAISALNSPDGSNKAAITKYIETAYGDLPPDLDTPLTAALASMTDSGVLTCSDNDCYIRPEAVVRKRGRGRPPKVKDELTLAIEKVVSGFPKVEARGRPRKKGKEGEGSVKRGRGRPPKAKEEVAA